MINRLFCRYSMIWGVLLCCAFYALCAPHASAQVLYNWSVSNNKLSITTPLTPEQTANLNNKPYAIAPPADGHPAYFKLVGDTKELRPTLTGTPQSLRLPTKNFSVEAWVKIEKFQEWGGIVGYIQDNGNYERGWLLGFKNDHFYFGLSTTKNQKLVYLTSPQFVETDTWYHVVGVFDGTRQRLYVDGKLHASNDKQGGTVFYPPDSTLTFGQYKDNDEDYPMTGAIESASIHNKAFNPTEVKSRFDARKKSFPGIIPIKPSTKDWPTWMRDNERTGLSDDKLEFPLNLTWVHQAQHKPAPAWPAPAYKDYWNKRIHHPRVIYDRAYHLVSANGKVYYGSSSDDQVHCLDLNSGKELWTHFAQGPVRLTPTIANGRLLFGSDDGFVYCLRADNGRLIWKHRAVDKTPRLIPGNERVISVWPVRSGVLVEGDTAFFCGGLFPKQGTNQYALDIISGNVIASTPLDVSPQGYLKRKGSRLYVGSGRAKDAFIHKLQRRGKAFSDDIQNFTEKYPYSLVGSKGVRIGGGEGVIAAFDEQNGKKLWEAKVDGNAYAMTVINNRLLVSTDAGKIYCFSNDAAPTTNIVQTSTPHKTAPALADKVKQVLTATNSDRGYALITNPDSPSLPIALAELSNLNIICLLQDQKKIDDFRTIIARAGLYGSRITVHHQTTESLAYTDYMFNLVITLAPQSNDAVAILEDELKRVLRPATGSLISWENPKVIFTRQPLQGIGEWSHMYANPSNTVCSQDTHVKGELGLQWFGRPGPRHMIDRHHRTVSPLWKDGRLFIVGDDRIIAADAYNGTQLWNRVFEGSRRIGAMSDASQLAAGNNVIYVAAKDKCHIVDAQSGKTIKQLNLPPEDAKDAEWGYVATLNYWLFGSKVKKGSSRRELGITAIREGAYFDGRAIVCSDTLFAYDEKGTLRWRYPARNGLIMNPTITHGDGRIYFIEAGHPDTKSQKTSRIQPKLLYQRDVIAVAIDATTGKEIWRKEIPQTSNIQHLTYMCYAQDMVFTVGSRNQGKNVHYDLYALDAKTGNIQWTKTQNNYTVTNGDHGEQDLHPVIVGDMIYTEPFAYNIKTGQPVKHWHWQSKKRRGCGNVSASADTFFFRQNTASMFDIKSGSYSKVTEITRPGCWINMIPAGGLLLAPEASSGCSCDFAIQTSLAFLPLNLGAKKPVKSAPKNK